MFPLNLPSQIRSPRVRLCTNTVLVRHFRAAQAWDFKIPLDLEDGEYLLRTEILGLHVAFKCVLALHWYDLQILLF